ncbi:MAG: hypothetical protein KF699_16630 [Phycisphaeraceae bacterium]|nr:hypothetical protein [Phycisphaeraceae bacterium]
MNTTLRSLLIIAALVSLLALAWTFSRSRAAREEAHLAHALLATVESHIANLDRLDAEAPAWTRRSSSGFDQGGMAAAINDALAKAGIPSSALASFSPPSDPPTSPIPAAVLRANAAAQTVTAPIRRRAVLTLAPVTLPQTGSLLAAWREAHPDWFITSIDLVPEPIAAPSSRRRDAAPIAPGADLPLRAVIALESLTAAHATPHTGARR